MLVDSYGRVIDYLRVSVTDRCNMRCLYCLPQGDVRFISHEDLLRYEEIISLSELLVGLGIRKIRITGGEPLIRKNILFLFERLVGLEDLREISLTTNGLLLGDYAEQLRKIGVGRVNVSIDTLQPAMFKTLTGSHRLSQVIGGIRAARGAGLQVKLNVVAMKGINDGEYPHFISFSLENSCDLRFIEVMPRMYNDRFAADRYISSAGILKSLQSSYRLHTLTPPGSAEKERLYQLEGSELRIGFISPISDPFCSKCNRLRLMSDGELKTCLYGEDGVNLRDILRKGCTDAEIEQAVIETVKAKPERHRIGCDNINLVMHRTGG